MRKFKTGFTSRFPISKKSEVARQVGAGLSARSELPDGSKRVVMGTRQQSH